MDATKPPEAPTPDAVILARREEIERLRADLEAATRELVLRDECLATLRDLLTKARNHLETAAGIIAEDCPGVDAEDIADEHDFIARIDAALATAAGAKRPYTRPTLEEIPPHDPRVLIVELVRRDEHLSTLRDLLREVRDCDEEFRLYQGMEVGLRARIDAALTPPPAAPSVERFHRLMDAASASLGDQQAPADPMLALVDPTAYDRAASEPAGEASDQPPLDAPRCPTCKRAKDDEDDVSTCSNPFHLAASERLAVVQATCEAYYQEREELAKKVVALTAELAEERAAHEATRVTMADVVDVARGALAQLADLEASRKEVERLRAWGLMAAQLDHAARSLINPNGHAPLKFEDCGDAVCKRARAALTPQTPQQGAPAAPTGYEPPGFGAK